MTASMPAPPWPLRSATSSRMTPVDSTNFAATESASGAASSASKEINATVVSEETPVAVRTGPVPTTVVA
ncbi:MAG: hypothetical protein CMN30_18340 [Sandaracinus sp.]|nr:hypothetical protein [Sandaracinus sp.]